MKIVIKSLHRDGQYAVIPVKIIDKEALPLILIIPTIVLKNSGFEFALAHPGAICSE